MRQPRLPVYLSAHPAFLCFCLSQSPVCPPGPVDPVLSRPRAPLPSQAGGEYPVLSTTTATGGHCLQCLPLGGCYTTAFSGCSRPSVPSTAFWRCWIRIKGGASGMGGATSAHCKTTALCKIHEAQPQTNTHCLFFVCVRCEMATAILTAGGESPQVEFSSPLVCLVSLLLPSCLLVCLSACLSIGYRLQAASQFIRGSVPPDAQKGAPVESQSVLSLP